MNRIRRSRIIFVGFGVLDLLQNTVWPLTSKLNMNRIRHNRIVFFGSVVLGLLQNTVWIVISELNTNRIRRNRIVRDSLQKTVWAGILEAHITWMDESLRNDIILVAFAVLDLLAKDKQPVMSQLDMNRMDSIKVRYLGVSRWKSEALAIHKTHCWSTLLQKRMINVWKHTHTHYLLRARARHVEAKCNIWAEGWVANVMFELKIAAFIKI